MKSFCGERANADEKKLHRIAVLQGDWPLLGYDVSLIEKIALIAVHVDVFCYSCSNMFGVLKNIECIENVTVYLDNRSVIDSTKHSIIEPLGTLEQEFELPLNAEVLHELCQLSKYNRYEWVIGIEKIGLLCACHLWEKYKIPYLYYSLELYLEDHEGYMQQKNAVLIRNAEKYAHRFASATIVQDELRCNALYEANQICEQKSIYIPVSIREQYSSQKNRFFHEKFNLPQDSKVLLYFGMFAEARYIEELIKESKRLPPNYCLILHGWGNPDYINYLKSLSDSVFFSERIVDIEDFPLLVSSADIGIAFYDHRCLNNKLTAFASEKIAYYVQSGLPFIAFNNESYRVLRNAFKCCELIEDISAMSSAIAKIEVEYKEYQNACLSAYSKYYFFDDNFSMLEEYLLNQA